MGHPLDLEIIDLVCEAAWAEIQAIPRKMESFRRP